MTAPSLSTCNNDKIGDNHFNRGRQGNSGSDDTSDSSGDKTAESVVRLRCNPYQTSGAGIRTECDRPPAAAYFSAVNTVSTAFWPSSVHWPQEDGSLDGYNKRRSCEEEACSVHVQGPRSLIETMNVYQEGRRRSSVLPFDVSSSVNFTTVTREDTRDVFATHFDLQRLLAFRRDGRNCGIATTNKNFMTVLHGVMNRDEYTRLLVANHEKDFHENSFFPPIKWSMVLSPSPSWGDDAAGWPQRRQWDQRQRETKHQLYKRSLAVNLQKYDDQTLTEFGPRVLEMMLQEAQVDPDLNRLCVDAEQLLGRHLSDPEKREILFNYYSAAWLRHCAPPSTSSAAAETDAAAFRFSDELQRLIVERLTTRSWDYKRYAYNFKRSKRKNAEIYDLCGDPCDPVRRCLHSAPFVSFVLHFLREREYRCAAEIVENAVAWARDDRLFLDFRLAKDWWDTHILQNVCSLF